MSRKLQICHLRILFKTARRWNRKEFSSMDNIWLKEVQILSFVEYGVSFGIFSKKCTNTLTWVHHFGAPFWVCLRASCQHWPLLVWCSHCGRFKFECKFTYDHDTYNITIQLLSQSLIVTLIMQKLCARQDGICLVIVALRSSTSQLPIRKHKVQVSISPTFY